MTSDAPPAPHADSPTILIIDDEPAITDAYARWLRDRYVIRTAYSGQDALEELDERVDIVLLDRRLPDIDGEDLLTRIHERNIDCRVAIISSVEPDFDILDLGFDLYIEKPVPDARTLRDAVATLAKRSEFNSKMQEYLALASKKAPLEAKKSVSDLAGNDEYLELIRQISELQAELRTVTDELDDDDLRVEFHNRH